MNALPRSSVYRLFGHRTHAVVRAVIIVKLMPRNLCARREEVLLLFRKHHIAEAHQFPGIYSRRRNHSRHRIAHSLIVTERLMQIEESATLRDRRQTVRHRVVHRFSHWDVFRQRFCMQFRISAA